MWDLPGPGMEPVFPLAGGFFTTEPPGNPPPEIVIVSRLLLTFSLNPGALLPIAASLSK